MRPFGFRISSRTLAGHSHYHNIKHRKARADAQRQTAFQKLSRDIYAAIKRGDGESNPSKNPQLARAIKAARKASMPKQRIESALNTISREKSHSETVEFGGVFPGGAGLLARASATRRNAMAAEMRSLISRAGGELGKASWMFRRRHTVVLSDFDEANLNDIIMFGIDQGADDVDVSDEGILEFSCVKLKERERLRHALTQRFSSLQVHKIISLENLEPKNVVSLSGESAAKFACLVTTLEDHVDIIDLVHNVDY